MRVGHASAHLSGPAVELRSDAGRRLRYDKLLAFDAAGRVLPSRLEVPAPDRLRLVVEDGAARHPIVIDPVLTGTAGSFLESNQPDPPGFLPAAFGASVAAAGDVNGDGFDDLFVGAHFYTRTVDDPEFGLLSVDGAAFLVLGGAGGHHGNGTCRRPRLDPVRRPRIEPREPGRERGRPERRRLRRYRDRRP